MSPAQSVSDFKSISRNSLRSDARTTQTCAHKARANIPVPLNLLSNSVVGVTVSVLLKKLCPSLVSLIYVLVDSYCANLMPSSYLSNFLLYVILG